MDRRTFLQRAGLAAGGAGVAAAGLSGYERFHIDEQIRWSGKAVGGYRPTGVAGTVFAYRVICDQPEVALTFDDGPSVKYTAAILRILERKDVPATFFQVGQHVSAQPTLARAVADAGHEIGNHTWSHPDLAIARFPQAHSQLDRAHHTIAEITGQQPRLYRPPYGYLSGATVMAAAGFGYPIILWDQLFDRGKHATAEANVAHLGTSTGPGSIVLGHDGGSMSCDVVVAALPGLIDRLRDRGLRFVTASALLGRQYPAVRS